MSFYYFAIFIVGEINRNIIPNMKQLNNGIINFFVKMLLTWNRLSYRRISTNELVLLL